MEIWAKEHSRYLSSSEGCLTPLRVFRLSIRKQNIYFDQIQNKLTGLKGGKNYCTDKSDVKVFESLFTSSKTSSNCTESSSSRSHDINMNASKRSSDIVVLNLVLMSFSLLKDLSQLTCENAVSYTHLTLPTTPYV